MPNVPTVSPDVQPDLPPQWSALTPAQKRERVIATAGELFAREGVDFPMPRLAAAIGVGVGTIYRQVGSKDDVLAELVVDRLHRFELMFAAASTDEDTPNAFDAVMRATLEQTLQDHVAKIAFDLALRDARVLAARQHAATTLQSLVDDAIASGGLRSDAQAMDLRMMFRAAREAERVAPGGGTRIFELVMDGLRRH